MKIYTKDVKVIGLVLNYNCKKSVQYLQILKDLIDCFSCFCCVIGSSKKCNYRLKI